MKQQNRTEEDIYLTTNTILNDKAAPMTPNSAIQQTETDAEGEPEYSSQDA